MNPKRRKTNPPKTGTSATPSPLDARQRSLAEEEAKLREKMEQYQKLIEDAPKIARERARMRREEIITRATRTEARPGNRAALIDRRFYEVNVAVPAQYKRLRAERRQGRLTFFMLFIVFIAVICWLYYTVMHS
jgi:hypothetical protein